MTHKLFFFWLACLALAPLYNVLGEKMILIGLFVPLLLNNKLKINRLNLFKYFVFPIFFTIKLIFAISSNYQPLSPFHSVYTLAFGLFEILALFILHDSLDYTIIIGTFSNQKKGRIFIIIMFYISLLSTIILMLIKGKDFYRFDWSSGGILVAPQFYLLVSVIISMALTYEAIKIKERRIVDIILILLGFTYVLFANYTTQMIYYLFGITLVLILTLLDTNGKRIAGSIILIVLTIATVNELPDFIYWINTTFFSQNATMYMRLNEIYTMLKYGDAGTDLNGRFELMGASFQTFKENWLFGVPFQKYNTVQTGIIVGDHSEWSDDLARYGVFGSVLWLYFIFYGIKALQA